MTGAQSLKGALPTLLETPPTVQYTLTLQDSQGVLWALLPDVASLAPAYPNRWRVVLADGSVAYLSQLPPAGPWVRLGDSWVNPRHLRSTPNGWQDPAGFDFPAAELGAPPEWEPVSELDYEVQLFFRVPPKKTWWRTDDGDRPCELSWEEAPKLYPELVKFSRNQYLNRNRLRRIVFGQSYSTAILDGGLQLKIQASQARAVAQALGIDGLARIDQEVPLILFRVREYPYEIASADRDRLRADFPDRATLILNLIWQARHYVQSGRSHDYGRDVEGFLAHPVLTTLKRADWPSANGILADALDWLNDHYQLITFQDLGFADPGPANRQIGAQQPHIVLVCEGQASLRPLAQSLAEEAGISLYLSEPSPEARIHLEFFLRLLRQHVNLPLRLLAWVDFLPPAWDRQRRWRAQAERLGLEIQGKTDFLAIPPCLTVAELQQHALPATGAEVWLQEGGGIDGRALGFLAECLLPAQRVQQRLHQLLGSAPTQLEPEIPIPAPDPPRTLALEDNRRIRFVPYDQIAVLAPAYPNRWRADLADGSVAYHPGPLPPGPWVPMGDCLVRPELLRREGEVWVSPVGFRFPYQPLPAAPHLPATPDLLPGLPCPPDHIVSVLYRGGNVVWQTDTGDQPCQWPLARAARLHPAMVWVSKTRFVNRHRIHRLQTNANGRWLEMDTGEKVPLGHHNVAVQLARALGLASFYHLEPWDRRMFEDWLREFPFELARAKGPVLRAAFSTPKELTANFLYQSFLYRLNQSGPTYADSFRDYYYFPLSGALERAGFLSRSRSLSQEERFLELLYDVFVKFVSNYRFFTYAQFGFVDREAATRIIGAGRPDVILLVEKDGIPEENARRIAERFGVSMIISGGIPSLMATEYFVQALRQVYAGPVRVIAYVDFDERGWVLGKTFVEQLAFYQCLCLSLDTMVLPQCFTPQEIALHSRAIPLTTPSVATLVRNWLAATGGINGQARGLYLDLLQPYERVQQRFEEIFSCY